MPPVDWQIRSQSLKVLVHQHCSEGSTKHLPGSEREIPPSKYKFSLVFSTIPQNSVNRWMNRVLWVHSLYFIHKSWFSHKMWPWIYYSNRLTQIFAVFSNSWCLFTCVQLNLYAETNGPFPEEVVWHPWVKWPHYREKQITFSLFFYMLKLGHQHANHTVALGSNVFLWQ